MSSNWGRFLLLFGVSAVCCCAQSTALGQESQALALEVVAIARWIGIIMLVVCGIGVMAGGAHMVGKIGGALVGLILALGAPSIVSWVQAHGAF